MSVDRWPARLTASIQVVLQDDRRRGRVEFFLPFFPIALPDRETALGLPARESFVFGREPRDALVDAIDRLSAVADGNRFERTRQRLRRVADREPHASRADIYTQDSHVTFCSRYARARRHTGPARKVDDIIRASRHCEAPAVQLGRRLSDALVQRWPPAGEVSPETRHPRLRRDGSASRAE